MRKTFVALAVAALFSAGEASAGPVTMSVLGSGGALSDVSITGSSLTGSLSLDAGQDVFLLFTGFTRGTDYDVSLELPSSSYSTVSLEILNATGGTNTADNVRDPAVQPTYVPAGWSTSNDMDGFSFAEDAGLIRSFMAGATSFALTADETTDMHDLLAFSGLGVGDGSLSFGLRSQKWRGDAFLVRLYAAAGAVPTPEPASMMLIGAGLLGAASALRRRRQPVRVNG